MEPSPGYVPLPRRNKGPHWVDKDGKRIPATEINEGFWVTENGVIISQERFERLKALLNRLDDPTLD